MKSQAQAISWHDVGLYSVCKYEMFCAKVQQTNCKLQQMIEVSVLNTRWILMIDALFNNPQHLLRFLQGRLISGVCLWHGEAGQDFGSPTRVRPKFGRFFWSFSKISGHEKTETQAFKRKGHGLNLTTFLFFLNCLLCVSFKHWFLNEGVFLLLQFPVGLERDPWQKLGKKLVARRFVYWGIQALVAFYMARDLRDRKKRGKRGEGTG